MPMVDSAAPAGSSGACSWSRDFGTKNLPPISATRINGTLMRNTEPHQKRARSRPPAIGPKAPAAPVTLAQMAIALGRSCGGKTLMRIDSVDGMMRAAPAPIRARQAISCHMAWEASPAPMRNRANPSWRAPLRPPVADGSGREQQAGEDQGVNGDHPLQLGAARVQHAGKRGQGHV